jgi:hypothetical protein
MADLVKSNLEPIEESDLDLEGKLTRGAVDHSQPSEKPVFKVEKEQTLEVVAAEKDSAYGNILAKVHTQPADNQMHDVAGDAQAAYQKTDSESQVQHLVDLALQKGVVHAVKVAQHLEDNYVLDAFHDKMLADELHSALVSKGLIEEI